VLIDCHLTAAARDAFFDFVRKQRISRLDAICLSHPDRDHFHGMVDVVDYFTSHGHSVVRYIDGGVDPKQICDLLRRLGEDESSEYERLQRTLDHHIDTCRIKYYRVDENSLPVRFESARGTIEIIPIAPAPRVVRQLQRIAARTGRVSSSLNAISIVLGLRVTGAGSPFNALLGGDAEASTDEDRPAGLDRAIRLWRDRCATDGIECEFDVVKIPHHGSIDGLSTSLTNMRRADRGLAVISVGSKYRTHPDRAVLEGYLDAGWTVLATCKRVGQGVPDRPLEVFARNVTAPLPQFQRNTVVVGWEESGGLSWEPEEASITRDELYLYETARQRKS
jgi:hypothetical protein